MWFNSVVLGVARSAKFGSTTLLASTALACGGATEPKIPFPMPDLTGTWAISFSAPGVALGDGTINDEVISTTFNGVAEVRIVQLDGLVSGDYVVEGEVLVTDRNNATTSLPIVTTAGQVLNGRVSWDMAEACGATRMWCLYGDLLGRDENTLGAVRGSVSQVRVEYPTQFDVGSFRFSVDSLLGNTPAYQFDGVGTATRVR